MSKKIVYVVLGLLVVVNIYARGLKQEAVVKNEDLNSSKNFIVSKTEEIFEYTNNPIKSTIYNGNLTKISEQNTKIVMRKMLKNQ